MYDEITAEGILKRISKRTDIEVYEALDSTNNVAKNRILEGCDEWHTVIALSQTMGEGRLGRSFFSPESTGLYMSCVLYPPMEKLGLITGMAAVSVCEAFEMFGINPKIKWVNDIFVNNKKVCGILAKSVVRDAKPCVILGVGVNVYSPEGGFPAEICGIAGALFDERKEGLRESLCAEILGKLMERYENLGFDDAPDQYKKRCITKNKKVTVIPAGDEKSKREGLCTDILRNYHAVVRYDDGTEEELSSGEVSIKI